MVTTPTLNAHAIGLNAYHRPLQEDGSIESWSQVIERVIARQKWLWERVLKRSLRENEEKELHELQSLLNKRAILPDGRTLWLSGTSISQLRESCMFNAAFTRIETVYDMVDLFWLLLQGCSVGFEPVTGTLNGFFRPLEAIEVIRSLKTAADGEKTNAEHFDEVEKIWTIKVGDTAESFAKAVGKLLAGKYPAKKLVIDLSEIRPKGSRLKGYGWQSTGDEPLASALKGVAEILSDKADQLLSKKDILNMIRCLNEVPASKQTEALALLEYQQPEWGEEADKKGLLFYRKPTKDELKDLFNKILESGGGNPYLINAGEASRRAPWFKGCNPNAEALLGNRSVVTFVEVNLLAFEKDRPGLERALVLAARMNYRQTLVDLRDEILQEAWHLNNEFLHLCGVCLTGVRSRQDLSCYDYKRMKNTAVSAAFGMAEELCSPFPKNVTCIKSSKTVTKIMGTSEWGDVPEGIELPLGKYLFHYMTVLKEDPLALRLQKGGYQIFEKPFDSSMVCIKIPLAYKQAPFSKRYTTRGDDKMEELLVNAESAVDQLKWYLMLQENWSEQNVSCRIYYEPSEVPAIIEWLYEHWDSYVTVYFTFRQDGLKNAQDLGLPFLEQEVISEDSYFEYVKAFGQVSLE